MYVSGALCGLSEVVYPGCDHADYPCDTVPKVVDKLFKAQLFHDQRQAQFRTRHSQAERATLEKNDYMSPIVADADMGFGGLTTTVKLVRSFVDAGVAMIHMDDLAIGLKKFTIGEGRTVVPTSEYVSRLTTARMQFDIMGYGIQVEDLGVKLTTNQDQHATDVPVRYRPVAIHHEHDRPPGSCVHCRRHERH